MDTGLMGLMDPWRIILNPGTWPRRLAAYSDSMGPSLTSVGSVYLLAKDPVQNGGMPSDKLIELSERSPPLELDHVLQTDRVQGWVDSFTQKSVLAKEATS